MSILNYTTLLSMSNEDKINIRSITLRIDTIDFNILYQCYNINILQINECKIINFKGFKPFKNLKTLNFYGNSPNRQVTKDQDRLTYNIADERNNIIFDTSIYDLSLGSLLLSNYMMFDFFKYLPDECNILQSLSYLSFDSKNEMIQSYNLYSYSYTDIKKYYQQEYYKVNDIEIDLDICKLALFPNLQNQLFDFIEGYEHIINILPKNRPPKYKYILPVERFNIILYYKNYCYCIDKCNKDININDDTANLILIINRDAMNDKIDDNILCLNNLPPSLTDLIIIVKCESHNNVMSTYEPYEITNLNNLPPSLNSIKLYGTTDCIDRIPYGCSVYIEPWTAKY